MKLFAVIRQPPKQNDMKRIAFAKLRIIKQKTVLMS